MKKLVEIYKTLLFENNNILKNLQYASDYAFPKIDRQRIYGSKKAISILNILSKVIEDAGWNITETYSLKIKPGINTTISGHIQIRGNGDYKSLEELNEYPEFKKNNIIITPAGTLDNPQLWFKIGPMTIR